MKETRAVEPLIDLLDDREVRKEAADALGMIGDIRALEPLIAARSLWADPSRPAYAIRQLGSPGAVASLTEWLDDPDPNRRLRAVTLIGELGGDEATETMMSALTHEDRDLRKAAIEALQRDYGGWRAREALTAILGEKDVGLRVAAYKTLKHSRFKRRAVPKIADWMNEWDTCTGGGCHSELSPQRRHTHSPYSEGWCFTCHGQMTTSHPELQEMRPPYSGEGEKNICLPCHESYRASGNHLSRLPPGGEENCLRCHDPHGSDILHHLRMDEDILCLECHEDTGKPWLQATVKHGARPLEGEDVERRCTRCHAEHNRAFPAMLKGSVRNVCYSCHRGGWALTTSTTVHEPSASDRCGSCHDPHGSNRHQLLTADYPSGALRGSGVGSFALCWKCHDREMALASATDTLTGFRNGTRNLHAVHVNLEKSVTCHGCHDLHSSLQAHLIRDPEPPHSRRRIPIVFSPSPSGATCITGCHREYSYDRERPVTY